MSYTTERWQPGEVIADFYRLRLPGEMPAGQYELEVGMCLLETGQRLPVRDEQGIPLGDRVILERFSWR